MAENNEELESTEVEEIAEVEPVLEVVEIDNPNQIEFDEAQAEILTELTKITEEMTELNETIKSNQEIYSENFQVFQEFLTNDQEQTGTYRNEIISILSPDESEQLEPNEELSLLATISENTQPLEVREDLQELSMFADLAVILLLMVVIVGFVFNFVKYVFNSLTRHI